MTTTIDKAIDLADKVTDQASIAMANVMDIATKYAPDAIEFGLVLGRIDAIGHIVIGLAILLCTIIVLCIFKRFHKEMMEETGGAHLMLLIFLIIPLMGMFHYLLNLYAWVGMFHPEVWLAAKALGWA